MLRIETERTTEYCDGVPRRDFLRVGGLAFGGLTLSSLMKAGALADSPTGASVVWLWLGGGPTHIETFDPKMDAPSEYRSVTGQVSSAIPGVSIGGTFPKIAKVLDRMAIVRSFTHTNSGHGGGTHWLMTGYDNRVVDNGGAPTRPAIGSIVSRVRGPNDPSSGMPTYVRLGRIGSDGPAFLGPAYAPFDPAGEARKDLTLRMPRERLQDRRSLLESLDNLNREVDRGGTIEGMDRFEQQAYNVILGSASKAFDAEGADAPKKSVGGLARQLLLARRLCEGGAGFVTVSYGGWDMHGNILRGLQQRSPELDSAVATFVEDLYARGLEKKILLVITGEFGRTPKINNGAGRDHWSKLSTLALAGGGLKMGQVVGESAPKADEPANRPVTPEDLMATIFHAMGIDRSTQFTNNAGRPVYMLEKGQPIRELV